MLPSSSVLCVGNAIFWKRSRWQAQSCWTIGNISICAELESRIGGHKILVCSTKSVASYAKDWGNMASDEELVEPLVSAHIAVAKVVAEKTLIPIWCGDFGCELSAFISQLAPLDGKVMALAWASAVLSVLGEESWTSLSKFTSGKAVDLILFEKRLRPVAALSGLRDHITLIEFLKSGYPSDHLLQLAVFVMESEFEDLSPVDTSCTTTHTQAPPGFPQ